ncbi:MAG: hypothetical protein IJC02_10685 [Lachnospiraceae bacterium]|nr:hypothetical protein [Lachnospiraceae bacterium]MBQ6995846.1 hypothetical protein [Lachnospiraceae bacterium]
MLKNEKLSNEEVVIVYKDDVIKLLRYVNWLEKMNGQDTSDIYKGEGIEETSMPVPVYDSTLLSFVREAKATVFMNRNYVYTFSQYRLKTIKDEYEFIEGSTLQDMKALGDILSKYVLKGEVKGVYWSEGVKSGVFLALLLKMKELIEQFQGEKCER